MRSCRIPLLATVCAALGMPVPQAAASPPQGLDYSADIAVQVDGLTLLPADAVQDDFAQSRLRRKLLPSGLDGIDGVNLVALATALDGTGAEQRWFAFDTWLRLPSGEVVAPGQPFRCLDDACSDSVAWSLPRLPQAAMPDAFAIDPATGDALFSLDTDARIDGVTYLHGDVLRLAGDTYSLALSGAALSRAVDLDTLDRLQDGRWLLGFDIDGSVGGTAFADDDVLVFDADASAWSLFHAPRARSAAFAGSNIDALAVARDLSDRIFADDFD